MLEPSIDARIVFIEPTANGVEAWDQRGSRIVCDASAEQVARSGRFETIRLGVSGQSKQCFLRPGENVPANVQPFYDNFRPAGVEHIDQGFARWAAGMVNALSRAPA